MHVEQPPPLLLPLLMLSLPAAGTLLVQGMRVYSPELRHYRQKDLQTSLPFPCSVGCYCCCYCSVRQPCCRY
jgi:hypothetical protein